MWITDAIRRWWNMKFKNEALEEFDVKPITSQEMDIAISQCLNVYQNKPIWLSDKNDIRTIGFGKVLCEETARLATLAIHVTIDGSPRAEWLQQQIDKRYFKFREWLEYGCAAGTFILKPNGKGVDFLLPNSFQIVDSDDDGNVTGVIFVDQYTESGVLVRKYFTKFEYHRITDTGEYLISNRTYISNSEGDKGRPVPIEETKWAGIQPDVSLTKQNGEPLERMLFGIFRTPQANNLDINSPLGLPIFQNVLEELKTLDTAYSRNSEEIKDSRRIILLGDELLDVSGMPLSQRKVGSSVDGLPHNVKMVGGTKGDKPFYEEINPELNTDIRINGINHELSLIGWKVGFSNGYFVLDQKTGMVTATQVEADDRRTIQFIKDARDKFEDCLDGLIFALNAFADLYGLAPVGAYETTYDFGDITYNREEDRARWWQYVMNGKVPAWMYYQKFEGMSEEEAKAMIAEAQGEQKEPTLFGQE
jgi:A118 family predicted phage portal protein